MTTQARYEFAYLTGRTARMAGMKLHQNPHAKPHGNDHLAGEWDRGFKDQDAEHKARAERV